jgi:predicted phage tail protein
MMTVMLYGHLGRAFGRVHQYEVKNAAEAVRALCTTLKGFRQAVIDGGAYRVLVGGSEALPVDRLHDPVSQRKTIRIVPVVAGASKGIGIIVGAVLIAVGYFFPGPWTPYLYNAGAAMIIGGVSQLLFAPKLAQPGANDRVENRPSYTFDGAVNTAAQGNPVPVLYGGPLIVGSQVVSAGLSVEQIA